MKPRYAGHRRSVIVDNCNGERLTFLFLARNVQQFESGRH